MVNIIIWKLEFMMLNISLTRTRSYMDTKSILTALSRIVLIQLSWKDKQKKLIHSTRIPNP
jgi:hypothetical protein